MLLSGSRRLGGEVGTLSYHLLPGYVVGAGPSTSQIHIEAVRERCQTKQHDGTNQGRNSRLVAENAKAECSTWLYMSLLVQQAFSPGHHLSHTKREFRV